MSDDCWSVTSVTVEWAYFETCMKFDFWKFRFTVWPRYGQHINVMKFCKYDEIRGGTKRFYCYFNLILIHDSVLCSSQHFRQSRDREWKKLKGRWTGGLGPWDGELISTVMIRPGAGWWWKRSYPFAQGRHLARRWTRQAEQVCVRACVCVGALTLVCHCHVFTQCYELQPWHCFHTPDMLLHPHSSASEESWNEPFLPPTQQPSNEKLWVLCVCVLSKMQQSKIYYVVRPKCLPSMENNKVISHAVAPFILWKLKHSWKYSYFA